MTTANQRKGKGFEKAVFDFLAEVHGRFVRRPHPEGFKDVGDLHLSPFVLQAKNYANVAAALTLGVDGAETQAVHAGEPFGAAVIKKRGANVSKARVAMSLSTFRALIARLNSAEDLLHRGNYEVWESHASAHINPKE